LLAVVVSPACLRGGDSHVNSPLCMYSFRSLSSCTVTHMF